MQQPNHRQLHFHHPQYYQVQQPHPRQLHRHRQLHLQVRDEQGNYKDGNDDKSIFPQKKISSHSVGNPFSIDEPHHGFQRKQYQNKEYQGQIVINKKSKHRQLLCLFPEFQGKDIKNVNVQGKQTLPEGSEAVPQLSFLYHYHDSLHLQDHLWFG